MRNFAGENETQKIILFFLFGIVSFLSSQGTEAKDLAQRLGVGYRNSYISVDLPSLSVVYHPNSEFSLYGQMGVDTEESNSRIGFGGGVRRIIFIEPAMNFYTAGQFALVNQEVGTDKNSGYEIGAMIGGEFFLTGLDNLAFNFETGFGVSTVKKTRFRTVGSSMIQAGMTFYF